METTEKLNCDVCSLTFTSKLEYFEHQLTLLHHKKIEEQTKRTRHDCQLCKQEFHNLLLFTQHIDSEKHRQKLQENRRASSSNVDPENIWYHTRPGFTNILSRSFSALKNTAKKRPTLIEPLMFPSDAVPKKRRGSKSLEEKQILTPPPDDSRLQSAHHTSTHSTVTSTCSLPRTSNQQSIPPISSYNVSTTSSFTEDVAVANFKEQEGSYFNPNDTTHHNIPFSRPLSHMTHLPDFLPLDNEPDLCSSSQVMTRRPIHQKNPPFSKDSRPIPDAIYQYKVGGKKVFRKGKFRHSKFEAEWHDRTDTVQKVGKEDDRGHVSQRKIGDTKKMSRDRVHHMGREQNTMGENTYGKKKGGMASSKRTETEMSIKSLKEKRHDELEKKLEQLRKNPRKSKPKLRGILEGKISMIPPGSTDKTLRKIPVDSVKQRKDGPVVGTNQSPLKKVVKTDQSNDQSGLIKNNSICGQNEIKQVGSTSHIIDHTCTPPTTSSISVNSSALQTEKKIDKMVNRREDFVVISTPSPPAGKITPNISPTSKLDKNSELHVEKTSKDRQANKTVLSKTTTPQTSESLDKSLTTAVSTAVAMDTSSLKGHSSSSLLTDSCLTSSKSNDFVSQAVNSLITTHVYDMMHGRLKLNEMGGSELTSMNTKQIKRPNQIENPDDDISAKRRKIGNPKSTPVVLPKPQSPVRTTSTGNQTVMTKTTGPSVVSKTPTPLIVPKPQPPVRTTTNTSSSIKTILTETAVVSQPQTTVQNTSNISGVNPTVLSTSAALYVVVPPIVQKDQSVVTKTAGLFVFSESHETVQNTTDTVKVQINPVLEPQPQPLVPVPSTINISTNTQSTQQVSSTPVVPSSVSSRRNGQPGMQSTNSSLITTSSMTNKPVSSINEQVSLMTNESMSSMTNEPVSSMINEPVSVVQVTNTLVQQIMEEAKELENLQNGQNSLKNSVTKTSNSKSRNRIESTDGSKKVSKSVKNTFERLKSPTKTKPSKPITHSATKHRKTKVLESSKEDSLSMETMETKSTDDGCHGNLSPKKRSSNQPISTIPSKMKSDGKDLMMVVEKVKIKQEPWSPSPSNACPSPMNVNNPYSLNVIPSPLESSLKEDLDSVPSPNQMSPQSKCCFRHQGGSHCGQFVNDGDRLCTEHKKVPEQLKAMLGLSPPKSFSCDVENIRSLNETPSFIQTETPCDKKKDNSPLPFEEPMEVTPTDLPDVTPSSPSLAIKRVSPASFKTELASLNKKEEEVQIALVDTESQLSDVSTELTELEERLSHLSSVKKELIDKCEKLTRQYQQVLSDKQTLLHTKCVTKYIPSLVKKTEFTPKDTCLQNPGMDSSMSKSDTHTTPTDTHTTQTDTHTSQTDNHTTPNDTHTTQTDTQSTPTDAHTSQTGVRPVSSSRHTTPEPCLLPHPHILQTETQMSLQTTLNSSFQTSPQSQNMHTRTDSKSSIPTSSSSIDKGTVERSTDKHVSTSEKYSRQSKHPVRTENESTNGIEAKDSNIKITSQMNKAENSTKKRINDEKTSSESKRSKREDNKTQTGTITKTVRSESQGDEVFFEPQCDDINSSNQTDPISRVSAVPNFDSHDNSVVSMKVFGNELYTSSSDKTTRAYNIQTGEVIRRFTDHQKSVTCLELYHNQEGTFILSGSSDRLINMYNVKNGRLVAKFKCGTRVMYLAVCGFLLFIAQHSGSIAIINLELKRLVGKQVCHEPNKPVSCVAVTESLLFTAAYDYTIACWDIKDLMSTGRLNKHCKKIKELSTFHNTVLCLKVQNGLLFCGSADKTVQIFDIKTWERVHCLTCHSGAVSAIEIMGKVLITACFDKMIRCFDLERLQLLQVYGGHTDMIFSLATHNGVIYSGSRHGSVQGFILDLTKFHECKWRACGLHFGILDHLREHIKVHRTVSLECKWEGCNELGPFSDWLLHVQKHTLLEK